MAAACLCHGAEEQHRHEHLCVLQRLLALLEEQRAHRKAHERALHHPDGDEGAVAPEQHALAPGIGQEQGPLRLAVPAASQQGWEGAY